jgi:Ribbon-helix-helix protein, copG family
MSKAPTKAAQFLAAMKQSEVPEYEAPPAPLSESIEEAAAPQTAVVRELPRPKPPKVKLPTRAGLKHFGGYLDDDTLEKIALLRVRLRKDNSELIKQAIEDLYRKHNAKRVFGDA